MDSSKYAVNWLQTARDDYNFARNTYGQITSPNDYKYICFHCQQAAEKAIKAVFLLDHLTKDMQYSHDLSILLTEYISGQFIPDDMEDELLANADKLTPYETQTRYPAGNGKYIIDPSNFNCAEALKAAKFILDWAENEIEKHGKE